MEARMNYKRAYEIQEVFIKEYLLHKTFMCINYWIIYMILLLVENVEIFLLIYENFL